MPRSIECLFVCLFRDLLIIIICVCVCLFVCLFCDGRRWRANSAAPTASSQTTSCASAAATCLFYRLHCCVRATCRVAWHAPPVRLHWCVPLVMLHCCARATCRVAWVCDTCQVALGRATCPVASARATCHVALRVPPVLLHCPALGGRDCMTRRCASSPPPALTCASSLLPSGISPLALAKWDRPHSC